MGAEMRLRGMPWSTRCETGQLSTLVRAQNTSAGQTVSQVMTALSAPLRDSNDWSIQRAWR